MALYTAEIQKLYIAYFNRPADKAGLAYWESLLVGGATMTQVQNSFSSSAEYQAIYTGTSNVTLINTLYNNLFGRDAEPAGLLYWAALMDAGTVTINTVANALASGTTPGSNDNLAIMNKIAAATAFTDALDTTTEIIGYTTAPSYAVARTWLSTVTYDAATLTTATASVDATVIAAVAASTVGAGSTFTLTTTTEAVTGTSGNDTFNGSNTTLVLDVLDGAAGTDTLNYSDAAGTNVNGLGLTLTSIETINVRSTGAAAATTTGFTGVENVNVLLGTSAGVTAATSTNVNVSGVTGAIVVDGGKNITVTDSTKDTDITIGATTVNAGNVTVTATSAGASSIAVDGGVNVTVNVSGTSGGADTITVGNGGAATDLPSGVVSVTSAHTGVAATDVTLNAITAKGGSTVTVTQTADTSKAAADTAGATLTQGAVTVVGGAATTSVTVAQAKDATEVLAVTAVAGVTESASVKFSALTVGQTLVMGGLTFTATAAMTAAEAAAVFANLVNGTIPVAGDTQGSGAASKGTYTGAFTGWTSGAVSTDTVVFTSTTANSNVGDLVNGGTGAATVTTTQGSAATAAVTGVLGVVTGAVVIDDNATAASIKTISVDGYAASSTIGATNATTVLDTLTLKNAAATKDMVVADTAATLALTVENMSGNSTDGQEAVVTFTAAPTTLNVTATGNNYIDLTAAATETLNVTGTGLLNNADVDLAALKTVTVTGSASLVLNGGESNTLTSVNTSGTTGAVTATIDAGHATASATYTGGAGVDNVTLATTAALTKAISLGAGDDTLSFGVLNVSGSTATLSGGDGTDTLSMGTVAAEALDGAAQTFYTGFERLLINNASVGTIDLANLGFTNYVTTTGSTGTLTLNNLASNGTVVITTAPTTGYTVGIKDAATGLTDVLNVIVTTPSADINAGTLTAAEVETINLTAFDSKLDDNGDGVNDPVETVTMVLTADKATSVNLGSSNANLALTMTGSTKVTSIDGSSMTGTLTVTSLNTTAATTIKGGSANDVLTAATGSTADVLLGNGGDDTLTANAGMDTLTGGAGNDLFVIGTASSNVNSYATITDFAAGDLLQLSGADSFASAKVTLGDTAVFQDYANAAINLLGANDAGWFQFGGNTYVVADIGVSTAFINGTDFIVKLTGSVDLTNASFNATQGTIAL